MVLNTREKGSVGEDVAERYLKKLGYKILGRNMTCRYGEIDLVAQKKNCLYFVEIKRRVGKTFGMALEAVSTTKQSRIRKSAEHFLYRNREWQKLIPYFSVIAIDEDPEGLMAPQIEFLPDAFQ
jgi:putative endonuclease